jgi:hypothetical protein
MHDDDGAKFDSGLVVLGFIAGGVFGFAATGHLQSTLISAFTGAGLGYLAARILRLTAALLYGAVTLLGLLAIFLVRLDSFFPTDTRMPSLGIGFSAGSGLTPEQSAFAESHICLPGANSVYHNVPGDEAKKTDAFTRAWHFCAQDYGRDISGAALSTLTSEQAQDFDLQIHRHVCLPQANEVYARTSGTHDFKERAFEKSFNACMDNLEVNSGPTPLTEAQIENFNETLYKTCKENADAAYNRATGSAEDKTQAFEDSWNECYSVKPFHS